VVADSNERQGIILTSSRVVNYDSKLYVGMKLSVMIFILATFVGNLGNAATDQVQMGRHFRQGKLYLRSSRAEVKAFPAREGEDAVTANRNWLQLTH
jgi:hypothetical protein